MSRPQGHGAVPEIDRIGYDRIVQVFPGKHRQIAGSDIIAAIEAVQANVGDIYRSRSLAQIELEPGVAYASRLHRESSRHRPSVRGRHDLAELGKRVIRKTVPADADLHITPRAYALQEEPYFVGFPGTQLDAAPSQLHMPIVGASVRHGDKALAEYRVGSVIGGEVPFRMGELHGKNVPQGHKKQQEKDA